MSLWLDKTQIREDYLRGFSVRMLAAKYDVPKSTIGRWVKQYGWVQEAKVNRKQLAEEVVEEESGTEDVPPIVPQQDSGTCPIPEPVKLPVDADYVMLRAYTQKLLGKANDLLELDDALAPRDLKSLSSMLLDVRTLMGIMSPREAAEQEMRMLALKRQAAEEQKTSAEVTVRFLDMEVDNASS